MSPENKHISGLNSSIISGPGSSKRPFLHWLPCPAAMNESTYWPMLAFFKIFTILTSGKWAFGVALIHISLNMSEPEYFSDG